MLFFSEVETLLSELISLLVPRVLGVDLSLCLP